MVALKRSHAQGQIDVSRHFSSPVEDKFAGVQHEPSKTGVPLLGGTVASIECKTSAVHDGGDHVIIIGEVVHVSRFEGQPLLFVQGRYATNEPAKVQAKSSPSSLFGNG